MLTQPQLFKYFGILVLHTVTPCRNFRMHWNPNVGNSIIKDTLTINEFEKIREFLHFNDNTSQKHFGEPGFDKLHKLRPVINELRERFRSIPLEENLSLDEQMCPTKARHHMRQYLPAKPKKHGFKFFVLCGASGYGYDFELYTGQESELLDNEDDLGASSNVVIRLTRSIPRHKNYKLFCDNYYTSMPLFHCLYENGILAVGTIRSNRIINNPMPPKTNKNSRGHIEEYITSYENCPFVYARWKDNKDVTLLSTYVGQEPTLTAKRYNRSTRQHDFVPVPQIIKCYNLHMGGVDLLDSVIGRARIIMRSRKWYMRIFYHLLDFAICNAWFLYNKRNETKLSLLEFRINLGTALCKIGQPNLVRRAGRPSHSPDEPPRKKLPQAAPRMPQDVRYDQTSHWPEACPKRLCKYENCVPKSVSVRSQSRIQCSKCKVTLCLTGEKNCFINYHMK